MVNSRDLKDLRPEVATLARKFIAKAKSAGIDLLVTSTYRDAKSQDALYAQGRTAPGRIVTRARGWQSWHQYRVAFDVVPIVSGKPLWSNRAVWKQVGEIGESVGLEWGGRWQFTDYPHFQFTGGKTRKQLRAEMEGENAQKVQ